MALHRRCSRFGPALSLALAASSLTAWSVWQGAPKSPQQAFPELSQRGSARIFYWGGDHSGGQVEIHYGQPAWNRDYDAKLAALSGRRWRLGQNFWTTLDTNLDLDFSGVGVEPGCWYLALERETDGNYRLWVLDPVEIRDDHLDAFQVEQTKGGIAIPMNHRDVPLLAEKLQIRLDVDANRKHGATLVIHYGKHELQAPLTMAPARD